VRYFHYRGIQAFIPLDSKPLESVRNMNTSRQFRDLADPTGTFEGLFRTALESLLPDLADAPWYVRERDVVNLFVFGHLVPQFQDARLDIGQIGIEVPAQVLPERPNERPSVYADIVVWQHNKATVWRTCKPLAGIEWKNISCRAKKTAHLEGEHKKDILHLRHNSHLSSVSYAVLTARQGGIVELRCKRIAPGIEDEFISLRREGTGDETPIRVPAYEAAMSRPQGCPDCVCSSAK
jgi:hypothetical protein